MENPIRKFLPVDATFDADTRVETNQLLRLPNLDDLLGVVEVRQGNKCYWRAQLSCKGTQYLGTFSLRQEAGVVVDYAKRRCLAWVKPTNRALNYPEFTGYVPNPKLKERITQFIGWLRENHPNDEERFRKESDAESVALTTMEQRRVALHAAKSDSAEAARRLVVAAERLEADLLDASRDADEKNGVIKFLRERLSTLEVENETLRQENRRLHSLELNAFSFKKIQPKVDPERVNSERVLPHGGGEVSGVGAVEDTPQGRFVTGDVAKEAAKA